MNEAQARVAICQVGRSLFERGYVHATAGNISVRLEDAFLITPTDACLGLLVPGQLAKIDLQGMQISGERASTARFTRPPAPMMPRPVASSTPTAPIAWP